jgi:hypothetical protein
VPELHSFDYAVLRVVPRVEREEFINAGVLLFCVAHRFLAARIHVDEARVRALCSDIDCGLIRERLEAVERVCQGDPDAGPIAHLTQRQRFHWLVAPRSTMLQVSPVHSGLCESPEHALDSLFKQLVLL